MDVEATLAELRELVARMNAEWDAQCAGDAPVPTPDHDGYRMAELFEALDGWIVKGGYPPKDWRWHP